MREPIRETHRRYVSLRRIRVDTTEELFIRERERHNVAYFDREFDTLCKISRKVRGKSGGQADRTVKALYRGAGVWRREKASPKCHVTTKWKQFDTRTSYRVYIKCKKQRLSGYAEIRGRAAFFSSYTACSCFPARRCARIMLHDCPMRICNGDNCPSGFYLRNMREIKTINIVRVMAEDLMI